MKKIGIFILILFLSLATFATHNRAGEITYRQISELTYEITLITYTYTPSAANESRDKLPIDWGDDTDELIPRIQQIYLPDDYTKNVYKAQHTFPGPGVYRIVMEDPNRNADIENIPASVNVVFSVATVLKIDMSIGFNTTPVLTNPPLDKAVVGQVFIHNPGAYDAEGDSLSYKLTECRQDNGEPIPGYTYPEASNRFYVDAITGDMVWDSPVKKGKYNAAMLIEEWRDGVKIGKVLRDMQIEVYENEDKKPYIDPLKNYCVLAGDSVSFDVTAHDEDGDYLQMTASGGPFLVDNPASYTPIVADSAGYSKYHFSWNTTCSNVRKQPYQATFKVREVKDTALVDFKNSRITVVSPAPENLILTPSFNTIDLTFDPCPCSQAIAYDIYRKEAPSGWNPSSCELGVPAYVGFKKIARLDGYTNTHYLDDNNGDGLEQGYEYCYRVVAVFKDKAESYASEEACTLLEIGYPLITKVSVKETDKSNGEMNIAWSKYTDFDTTLYPGPYMYHIYRSQGFVGANLLLIDSTMSENDTTYLDKKLNTKEKAYSYSIKMYNNTSGKKTMLGTPQLASSHFLSIEAGDNKLLLKIKKNVPWVLDTMVIFRKLPSGTDFDSIACTSDLTYLDSNLENEQEYCYYIKAKGHYSSDLLSYPLCNYSQKVCATPKDTVPPCAPQFTVNSYCDDFYNLVSWKESKACLSDVKYYNIYYSPTSDGELEKIYSTFDNTDTSFQHNPDLSIAGCYVVTAVDSFENESAQNQKVCIDNCIYYELPNIFTPNADTYNDLFIPGPYKFVQKIDLKIYNRWGTLVFTTQDPDINWDGRDMNSGKILHEGVYYYTCDVYEYRLSGVEVRLLTGFIHMIDPKKQKRNE